MSAKNKHDAQRFKEFRNSKLHQNYEVLERLEAGISLVGTEIKSVRAGLVQLADSFCRFSGDELWAYHVHIAEYSHGSFANHDPVRPRKILLHAKELRKWKQAVDQGGKVIVPVRLYFKKALLKAEIALCTPKKQYDKREDLKKQEAKRDVERAMSARFKR